MKATAYFLLAPALFVLEFMLWSRKRPAGVAHHPHLSKAA
jgi:hypothetical protein